MRSNVQAISGKRSSVLNKNNAMGPVYPLSNRWYLGTLLSNYGS